MTSPNPHLLLAALRRTRRRATRRAPPVAALGASLLLFACTNGSSSQYQTSTSTSTSTTATTSDDPRDLPSTVVSSAEPLFNDMPPDLQVSEDTGSDTSDARLQTCVPSKGPGEVLLIDDFEDGDEIIDQREGRSGIWYQYQEHAGDHRLAFESLESPRLESNGALHTSGTDHGQWAGVGVALSSCVYDASTYVGVHFWIRGDSAAVNVALVTPGVIPVSEGGTCTKNAQGLCYDAFRSPVSVTEQWRELFVPFSSFEQLGYGPEVALDLTRLESIQFQSDSGAFDLWIDDVSFYVEEVYTSYDASVPTSAPETSAPTSADAGVDTSAVAATSEPTEPAVSSAPVITGDGGSL